MTSETGETPSATRHSRPGIFARGVAMGMAEAVPGVSGGTIAFVTGIYDELVKAIAAFSHTSASTLVRDGWDAFARRHNLGFLAVLAGGMAIGLPVTLMLVAGLLASHRVHVTGFFFGLIAASVVVVGRQSNWRWLLSLGLAGAAGGILLGTVETTSASQQATVVFMAGALASTAWILPGLSGAFVLVVLGLYEPMAKALLSVDLRLLVTFAAGMGIGVVCFAKLLAWSLEKARPAVLAVLTGLMAGSLTQLWPWRETAVADTAVAGVVLAIVGGILVVGVLGVVAGRREGGVV